MLSTPVDKQAVAKTSFPVYVQARCFTAALVCNSICKLCFWTNVQKIFSFGLLNPRKPCILAMSRPDAKKNLTTLVKAFGENRTLRNLANLVLVMVRPNPLPPQAPAIDLRQVHVTVCNFRHCKGGLSNPQNLIFDERRYTHNFVLLQDR
jgi:hypothetical protein